MTKATNHIVTAPGIYPDIPAAVYHTPDLTPVPALSSSSARALLGTCPARFYYDHVRPRLPVYKRVFDIGQAAHLIVLEPHLFEDSICVVQGKTKDGKDSAGYASADAKAQRDEAYATGRVPLLPDERDAVLAMRNALFADPVAAAAFNPAHVTTEQTRVWIDEETGVWCKSRLDAAAITKAWIADYKTTRSARPDDVAKATADYGYHIQAAWYLESVAATGGPAIDRFAFVFQEKEPPYLCSVHWLAQDWLDEGRKAARAARVRFAECMKAGKWPGYQPATGGAFDLHMPGWMQHRIEERENSGSSFFDPRFATAFQGFDPAEQGQ